MPRGNGTGPRGVGRMSGRGAGFCAGHEIPGYANPLPGRGSALGFGTGAGFAGGGRGWRNCFHATGLPGWVRFGGNAVQAMAMRPAPEMEKQVLRTQLEVLETELDFIKKRLASMDNGVDEGQ